MSFRVLVIDDHPVLRSGLRTVLCTTGGARDVVEAATGREGLRKAREPDVDVVTLDLGLPDLGGLEVLKAIRLTRPELPVIVFSLHADRESCIRSLRAGAMGYVMKAGAANEILDAVSAVVKGRRYISPGIADHVIGALLDDGECAAHERLSDREFQVLCLLGVGRKVSDIAEQLCLSVKTISTYRARVREKLGLANDAEIVKYVLENDLAP